MQGIKILGSRANDASMLLKALFLLQCKRGGGLPGAGTCVTPSLNHAGCVSLPAESYCSFLWQPDLTQGFTRDAD
jgi:hypothetical protein